MGALKEARRKERQAIYNTGRWRDLRTYMVQKYPLCQNCLKAGKYTPTQEVHHIKSPFVPGLTEEEKYKRAYDENNLLCLCRECHIKEHHKDELTIIEKLDKYKY